MIDVRLLYGGGWETPAEPPGRRLLAAGSATLAELADAIDLAFARLDNAHLRCFELGDGSRYILGGRDERDPPAADSQTITLQRAELARIGVQVHLHVRPRRRLDRRLRGRSPGRPAGLLPRAGMHAHQPAGRIFGWGTIPDQHGRLRDDDQT